MSVFADKLNKWGDEQPDAIAVEHDGGSTSYARLRSLVAQRAVQIENHAPGDAPLVLVMAPGVDYLTTMLACLCMRRTFIPITENLISTRLAATSQAAAASTVLTDATLMPLLDQSDMPIFDVSRWADQQSGISGSIATSGDGNRDTAYIITTSGSTGTPKLVQGSHKLLADFIDWEVRNLELSQSDRIGALTALSFDVSLRDLLVGLFAGGTLCIADPRTTRSPSRLLEWLTSQSVTLIHVVPTLARALCDAATGAAESLPDLRHALFAGEPLTGRDVRMWRERISNGCKVFNVYGPSETTLAKVVYEVSTSYADDAIVPLGQAITGADIRICDVDNRSHEQAAGELGEIIIDVDQPCPGYLGDDIRTRRQFDFHAAGCSYATGDLGYIDDAGLLHYAGRKDGQVKINGQRVELAEIETALRAIHGVRQAVANPYVLPAGGTLIAGYLTGDDIPDPDAIRRELAGGLPEHMLPSRIVLLEQLPLTDSGKIDRRNLPIPDSSRPAQAQLFVAPGTKTQALLCELLGQRLGIDRIGIRDNFFDLGGTSLIAMSFIADIEREFPGREFSIATFFDLATVERIGAYLDGPAELDQSKNSATSATAARRARTDEHGHEIAIIGMAGRFPGAKTVAEFWQLLQQETESISQFQPDDLDPSLDENTTNAPNYVAARGIISGAKQFDADFFGVRPREAELLDPAQRVLLETAWQTLEDASYAGERLTDRCIGVFAGVGDNSYLFKNILSNPRLLNAVGEHQIRLANEKDYVASRIAYKLNLTGPAISVHTACSTSLVAVAQAVEALRSGRCSMALAGGAFIATPQRSGYLHTEGGFASADGHCRPFDANATGTVFSSGAGMVLLKPLQQAQRDGDQIIAVIQGVATNNDGAQRVSFMAPSVTGQASCVSAALLDANVVGSDIGYVEAHGTATPVGDPIEVEALARAYGDRGQAEPVRMGSAKGNIGHLDAAAGITGLIKAALMLKYNRMPASLNFDRPNPAIDFDTLGLRIQNQTEDWPSALPKRASVSSFGVGGTNAHVILRSVESSAGISAKAPQTQSAGAVPADKPVRITLSARSADALQRQGEELAGWLADNSHVGLNDLAYTLRLGRAELPFRRTVLASSSTDLQRQLGKRMPAAEAHTGARQLVFAFPGQGAQRPGMAMDLYAQSDIARSVIDTVATVAEPIAGIDIRKLLLSADPDERIHETRYTQICLFATELAAARFLLSMGARPDVLVGHSIGEFAAACLSGLLSVEQASRLVAIRGRLMQALPRGSMAAIGLSADELRERLPDSIAVAADNAPTLSVAAGPTDALAAFADTLEQEGVFVRTLSTSHAFHSPMMNDMLAAFGQECASLDYGELAIPMVSTLTGEAVSRDELATSDYWLRHISHSVLFRSAIDSIAQDGDIFQLEVGPGQSLTSLTKQITVEGGESNTVTSNAPNQDETDWDAMLRALTVLDGSGSDMQWHRISSNPVGSFLSVPPYPFAGPTYWLEPMKLSALPVDAGEQETGQSSPLQELLEAVSGLQLSGENRYRDFVELGFDSLLLTQVGQALASQFGASLSLKELMQTTNSLDKLAAYLGDQSRNDAADEPAPVREALAPIVLEAPSPDAKIGLTQSNRPCWFRQKRRDSYQRIGADFYIRDGAVDWVGNREEDSTRTVSYQPKLFGEIATVAPLTKAQRELWLTEQLGGDGVELAFIEAASIKLHGPLDVTRLHQAINSIASRHEALRGQVDSDGHLFIIRRDVDLPLTLSDARAPEIDSPACQQQIRDLIDQPFDLNTGPLVRFSCLRFSDNEHLLLFAGHHIVIDGYSKGTILDELGTCYGAEHTLPAADAFSGFAREYSTGSTDALAWWLNRYDSPATTIDLPVDSPRQPIRGYVAGREDVVLEQSALIRLRELAASNNASLFSVLLAGFSMVLSRISRQNDLVIGVPASGQVDSGALNLIGHCVNFLPFRMHIEPESPISEHVAAVASEVLDAHANQRFTFGELAERVAFDRDPSRPPLVSVMFNVDQAPHDFDFGNELTLSYSELPKSHQNMELSVNCNVRADRLIIECGFNSELFDIRTIGHWMESFAHILRILPSHQDTAVTAIPALAEKSTALVLDRWGQRAAQCRWQTSFVDSIWARAEVQPEQIAVSAGGETLTYRQLTTRADQLAVEVARIGVHAGVSRIGICVNRSVNMLASVLAVLRTGAAYVPLDPGLPEERIRYMIEDADLAMLVTDNDDFAGATAMPVLRLDEFEGLQGDLTFDAPTIAPDWPAYVIYTSGSTGKPKGVVLPHRSVANFLSSMAVRPGMTPSDVLLAVTTLSFDISVLELYLPLTLGARVVIADRQELVDGEALIKLMDKHSVTMMQATPATWRLLLDAGWSGHRTLKALCGGEALPKDLAESLLTKTDSLWNMYGPTETTVWSTVAQVSDHRDINIGTPIHETSIFVLDSQMQPVPVGVPGEMYIGGGGVATGYLGRDELTRERFVDNPFSTNPSATERLYRTGDEVRWRHDGSLEYYNRLDNQVKVRGFRIELGEIEAALNDLDEVDESAVVVHDMPGSGAQLIAYAASSSTLSVPQVRKALRAFLPEYMIPGQILSLSELPKTPNGKIDRNALPEPSLGARRNISAPATAAEQYVAQIWRDLIASDTLQLDVSDNFFEQGGHSLLAARFVTRVRREYAVEIPVRELVLKTLGQIAHDYLESAMDQPTKSGVIKRIMKVLRGSS
ncbi:MAG: amino acid adenylation domain-containing protein [Pseudomonadaceae bacterium]|nr:amino acid adenylation domain-containing protein [Pseudomonadaceae bacterium]